MSKKFLYYAFFVLSLGGTCLASGENHDSAETIVAPKTDDGHNSSGIDKTTPPRGIHGTGQG